MKTMICVFAVFMANLVFMAASNDVHDKRQESQGTGIGISSKIPGMKPSGSANPIKLDIDFGKIPLYFIANQGQVNQKAVFYARASRYTLWLTKKGLVFDSLRKVKVESSKFLRDVSRLVFLDANKNPEMVALDKAAYNVNYFIGSDKSKWRRNIPTSQAVLYKNIYKHIDLKVYGIEKQVEYDWIVKPGGNPGDIKFRYNNVKTTRIADDGNLIIETDFGELMHRRPVSYQEIGNNRIDVNAGFKKISKNTYGFAVGKYDKRSTLIIDPVVLVYSTYLGGRGEDQGNGIAVDGSGHAYVTGWTTSDDFPTKGSDQGAYKGQIDVFVTKLDTTQSGASSLIYSTYLGGGGHDSGNGIAVDGSGHAYVTGGTNSADFPTEGSDHGAYNGQLDVFVTKLSEDGSSLIYSTYLGGVENDVGYGIAVDGSDYAYVTGGTNSTDFPTHNGFKHLKPSSDYDVFVTKLPQDGSSSSLLYSTYLGGGGNEEGRGIAVDGSFNAYVTGSTNGGPDNDFPKHDWESNVSYIGVRSLRDVFVTKLDTTQYEDSSHIYSSLLCGDGFDEGWGIAVDGSGYAYVTGSTTSPNFPTQNPYQIDQPGSDVFVTKLDKTQGRAVTKLIYSTYLGGGGDDEGRGIAVDLSGNVYVTGYTASTDFPTWFEYQGDQTDTDVFVTKFAPTGSSLIYSTYLGGGGYDEGRGIAIDDSGNAYVTGYTSSTDFPTQNHYHGNQNGSDAFVTKISLGTAPNVVTAAVSGIADNTAECGGIVTYQYSADVTLRGVCWSISPNPTISDTHTTDGSGTGVFTSSLTGLTQGILYHVRAYAEILHTEIVYGNEVTFTTTVPANIAVVTTTAPVIINSTMASSGGTVVSDGGAAVTARGVCWSTNPNPTTAGSHTNDGTGTGEFASKMTGLTPGTFYYVRAYATNSAGTAYGSNMTFTTAANLPRVTTGAVSGITTATATCGGNVTSDGGAAVTSFGVCWSTTLSPTISGTHTTDGSGTGVFTSSLTGLFPGTTYHVRAYATNTNGTAYGDTLTFTTIATYPSVTTAAVTAINSTTVSCGGNVTNDGGAVVRARGVCWSTVPNPTTAGTHTTDGRGTGTFVSLLTGLTPGAFYYVRAYATNSAGTAYGSNVFFTTASNLPTVTTGAIANVTATTASCGGDVTNDGGSAVTARGLCWNTSPSPTISNTHSSNGTGVNPFTAALSGLTPDTIYYVRAYATNSSGTAYGMDKDFTTGGDKPAVVTAPVSAVTSTTASCGGNVTYQGAAPVTARGVCWDRFPNPTTAANSYTANGSGTGTFTSSLTGLYPGTLYYVRAYATNSYGTTYGNNESFTTGTVLPSITTYGVANITGTSAVCGGNVVFEGGTPVTAKGLCWSTTPNPTTANTHTNDGGSRGDFTRVITGLTPETTYHVRAYATNTSGTAYGSDVSFTTTASGSISTLPTVITAALSNINPTYVTCGGNVTSDGGENVTARGVCWSTSPNPTTAGNYTVDGSGTGTFTSFITGLTQGTTYYIRAYATNAIGTGYGSELTFTAGNLVISGRVTKNNNGFPGVTLSFSGLGTTPSDFNGNYSHTVPPGWSGTLSPSQSGYAFTPASRSYSNVTSDKFNQDFTGSGQQAGDPEIYINLTRLNYTAILSGSKTNAQDLLVANHGGGILDWTIETSDNWIQVNPASGKGDHIVSVSGNLIDPSPGENLGFLTISDPAATNSRVIVTVYASVKKGPDNPPKGSFDTPGSGSVVSGSIPVTGWAIDDVDIASMKIYRGPVPGEGTNQVFIGDATFVEGARPDVATANPTSPRYSSAGWGYMLLTHFLPNQGNGSFTLYARVTDNAGHEVTLGSKTITCDNASAVKPFGAIDTPAQGGFAQGSHFISWGWVLTPKPNQIPTNGTTIYVNVDGQNLGHPVYNNYRADIAALFPGYNNSNGASGYFELDTTAYTAGVHTISWNVRDNAGNAEGIGSRYFTILNPYTGASQSGTASRPTTAVPRPSLTFAELSAIPLAPSPWLTLRKGYQHEAKAEIIDADDSGAFYIETRELERLEVDLGYYTEVTQVSGFMVVGNELWPLPAGTTLVFRQDKRWLFLWQPGPGFNQVYHFAFIAGLSRGGMIRKDIIVKIAPHQ